MYVCTFLVVYTDVNCNNLNIDGKVLNKNSGLNSMLYWDVGGVNSSTCCLLEKRKNDKLGVLIMFDRVNVAPNYKNNNNNK